MRWLVAHLYADERTAETDALGVPVAWRTDLGEAMVRSVPLADSLRSPRGENPYDEREVAFATPIPLRRAQKASVVALGADEYEVTGVCDAGRMRLLTARKVKR